MANHSPDNERDRQTPTDAFPAPHGAELLDCVGDHLRASEVYARCVSGRRAVDVERESEARRIVMETMTALRQAFERRGTEGALREAVRYYIDADDRRERLSRGFGSGEIELDMLEAAIAMQRDAADELRIVALDCGVDL